MEREYEHVGALPLDLGFDVGKNPIRFERGDTFTFDFPPAQEHHLINAHVIRPTDTLTEEASAAYGVRVAAAVDAIKDGHPLSDEARDWLSARLAQSIAAHTALGHEAPAPVRTLAAALAPAPRVRRGPAETPQAAPLGPYAIVPAPVDEPIPIPDVTPPTVDR